MYVVEEGSCVPFQNLADLLLAVVAIELSWWCARFRASLKILVRQERGGNTVSETSQRTSLFKLHRKETTTARRKFGETTTGRRKFG